MIEDAYHKLARFAAASGPTFRVRLSGFRTVEFGEFHRTPWWDVVTAPGGDMIDMTRSAHTWTGEAVGRSVTYVPSWRLDAASYLTLDTSRTLRAATVADMIAQRALLVPETANALALTTYRVRVTLDGRSRTYRAAAVWFPDPETGSVRVSLVDLITQGVDRAVLEPRSAPPRAVAPSTVGPAATARCEQSSKVEFFRRYESDVTGHSTGSHFAWAEVGFQCDCRDDCLSSCRAEFRQHACLESDGAITDVCHVMSGAIDASIDSHADGVNNYTECGAGLQCLEKTCYACWCSVAASVDVSKASFTWGSDSGASWRQNFPFTFTCDKCTPYSASPPGDVEGPEEPIIDDGGLGSDSSWYCCQWGTTCFINRYGEYECRINNQCQAWCRRSMP